MERWFGANWKAAHNQRHSGIIIITKLNGGYESASDVGLERLSCTCPLALGPVRRRVLALPTSVLFADGRRAFAQYLK